MLWDCRYCKQTLNHGLEKHCRNCGHPKDENDREYMPESVSLQDALDGDKKRRAEAGPDWKCKHCESLQNSLNKCCTECGVPVEQGEKTWKAEEYESTFDPFKGFKIEETAHKEVTVEPRHSTIHPPATETPPPQSFARTPKPPMNSNTGLRVAAFGIPGALLFGFFFWFLFHTKVVHAKVSTVAWTHAVKIDRYQIFHRDGWYPEGSAFNTRDMGPRIHHYDHVRTGSHDEPYTVQQACGKDCRTIAGECSTTPIKCTPNKNGAATCKGGDRVCSKDRQECSTKYCDVRKTRRVDDYEDVPRFQEWFAWDAWDWAYNRTVTASGSNVSERWPSADELKPTYLNPGEQERESGRSLDHKVTFANTDGTWNISPDQCSEFEKYAPGSKWRLKVSIATTEVLGP